jgi:hypothetical protein
MRKIIIFLTILFFLPFLNLFAQTNLISSEQGIAGGKTQEDSISMVAIIGQPGAAGPTGNDQYFLLSGFIATTLDTLLDTLTIVDTKAPSPPENLTVSPNTWTNNSTFTVNWTNPYDVSGIEKAYYKFDSAPANNHDTTASASGFSPFNLLLSQNGQHNLYVWLEDSSGNTHYDSCAQVTLYYDSIEPVIDHVTVTADTVGKAITISAPTTDQYSGLDQLYLYYRKTGDNAGLDSVLFSGTTAVIPASINTQRGVEYSLIARDIAGNTAKKPESGDFYSIKIVLTGNGGVELDATGQPIARHSGTKVTDYRIFSVPFVLENKKPSALFEPNLEAYDPVKWKLFTTQAGELKNYDAIKNLDIVEPGRGFLLILNISNKYIYSGNGYSPDVNTYSQIQLNEGWNLIGNPFDFDIPLDKLSINGSTPEAYYYNDTGWVIATGNLNKWEGLAIYDSMQQGSVLNIDAGSGAAYNFSISNMFEGNDWGIKLIARGEESIDLDNYIGIYSNGNKAERTIWHEPPRLTNAVSLRIVTNQHTLKKGNLPSNNILSTQIQKKGKEGNYWDFELVGDKAGEKVILDIEYFAEIPDEYQKYMIDLDLKTVTDLSTVDSPIEMKIGIDKKRNFRIIVGSESFVSANASGIALKPLTFELRQNFPNPFNPNTNIIFTLPQDEKITLEVFNILGQLVKSLIYNETYRSGYHTVEWNGKNTSGESAASGMYIFRLRASDRLKIRKGILLR